MLFGISNALVFSALRQGLRSQAIMPRSAAAHTAAWSTLLEVAIITVQAWRGEPSHFNTSTPLNAAFYTAKLVGASLLGVVCLGVTAGCAFRPTASGAKLAALRSGLALLSVAVLVGFGQVVYGHSLQSGAGHPLPPAITEQECRIATAGTSGAPCYEVFGAARLKILHFMPLHATEALLALAWGARTAGLAAPKAIATVHLAAFGLTLLTVASAWQVARGGGLSLQGLARLHLELPAAVAVLLGLLAISCAAGRVAVCQPKWGD